jgi:CubicO group peptidase (beta-lactamase class C family)
MTSNFLHPLALTLLAVGTCHLEAVEPTTLAQNAITAAKALPQGGIVIGETLSSGTVFSTAGKLEPAGVAPEKLIFEIGSVSKVFTGLLLAQAVVGKKLSLETPIRDLVDKGFRFADPKVGAITLRQLATHTSGLPRLPDNLMDSDEADPLNPYAHYDRAMLAACLANLKLEGDGPYSAVYSNLGAGLLGELLARIYGKTWEELVVERIAKPLDMLDTVVALSDEQSKRFVPAYAGSAKVKPWTDMAMAGAGALRSTAEDMMKFGKALAKPENSVMKDAIELLKSPQSDGSIGLFVQILKLRNGKLGHWMAGGTGGFSSWLSVRSHDSRIVVILCNNSECNPEEIISGKPLTPVAKGPADPALAEFVGEYETGVKAADTAIHYRFEARGAELWMQVTGQPAVPLGKHATKKDRFMFAPANAEIQFTRDDDKVVSTTLFQAGLEIKAKKLNDAKP